MQPSLNKNKEKHRLGAKKVWLFDKLAPIEHPMIGKGELIRSFAGKNNNNQ